MPLLNGYEVAQRLRGQEWGKNVLLIAQTGWGQAEDIRQCREAGFNHHVTKPIDFQKLREFFVTTSLGRTLTQIQTINTSPWCFLPILPYSFPLNF